MAPLSFSVRLQRQVNASTSSQPSNQQNSNNGRIGGYHRGMNVLTRLNNGSSSSGSRVAATSVARNVPRPVQTSSLKKENGGQDINAVLVNRNNGSGKKVGWGSALPTETSSTTTTTHNNSSEPTPAETSSIVAAEKQQNQNIPNGVPPPSPPQQPPPVPPPPPPTNSRNVPWALHPPSNPHTTNNATRSVTTQDSHPTGTETSLPPSQQQQRQHQFQEKGEDSLQQDRHTPHHSTDNAAISHNDYQNRRPDPHHPSSSDVPPHGWPPSVDRYERDDRFSHQQDHQRSSTIRSQQQHNYRDRGNGSGEPYDHRHHHHHHNNTRGFDSRGDFRDRDHRYGGGGGPDYRYDYRDRDYHRDSSHHSRWFERERGGGGGIGAPPPYDHRGSGSGGMVPSHRSHSPNYYSRGGRYHGRGSDERRWDRGDGDYHSFSGRRRSYEQDNREAPRHGSQLGIGQHEDSFRDRRRHHEPRSYRSDGRDDASFERHRREGFGMQPPHSQSWNQSGPPEDGSRFLIPPRTDYLQPPSKSEDDVAMQAVREREAADARMRMQKESLPPDNYGAEKERNIKNERSCSMEPITILRNKQASGEASGDAVLADEQKKNDAQAQEHQERNETQKEDSVQIHQHAKTENSNTIERASVISKETNEVETETEKQPTSNVLEEQQTSEQLVEKTQEVTTRLPLDSIKNVTKNEQSKNHFPTGDSDGTTSDPKLQVNKTEVPKLVLKAKEVTQKSEPTDVKQVTEVKDTQHEKDNSELDQAKDDKDSQQVKEEETPTKDIQQAKDEQALEQQQNVLRHVAASRKNSKNVKTSIRRNEKKNKTLTREIKSTSPNEETSQSSQTQKPTVDETIKEERDLAEANARAARAEHRRTRGPRTKGVLFRRLPDGTLVNADLTEEEIARREQKKKAREEKIRVKEEKARAREEKRKAREEKKKAREEKIKAAKEERNKPDVSKVKKGALKIPEKPVKSQAVPPSKPKPKPFVPAPPPAVSAWKAGPPPGFIKASTPSTTRPPEASSKPASLPKPVVGELSTDSESGSSISNSAPPTEVSSNEPRDEQISSPSPIADVSIQFESLEKSDTRWDSSKKNQNGNTDKFRPVCNPIALPISGVTTWNTFGAPNHLFAPPQENGAVSTDWSVRKDSNTSDPTPKTMTWTDTHPAPIAHPSSDDDEVAEITDASAAVPKDLLSSAPGSEDDNMDTPNEAGAAKDGKSKRNPRRQKGPRNFDKRGPPRNRTRIGTRKRKNQPKQDPTASEADATRNVENEKKTTDTVDTRGKRPPRRAKENPKKISQDNADNTPPKKTFSGRLKKSPSKGQQENRGTGDVQNKRLRTRRPTQRNRTTRKPRGQSTQPPPSSSTATTKVE